MANHDSAFMHRVLGFCCDRPAESGEPLRGRQILLKAPQTSYRNSGPCSGFRPR